MKYNPIIKDFPHFLHGGDYNPEQWMETPEIWDEDMRLMKLANCNSMTVGVFAWSALEPEEGHFEFGWLDTIMDKIADNGGKVILATPSGARPAWMSQKYPEVLQTTEKREMRLHGGRHNHCFTSPIYREKVRIMNTKLAERYKNHPALGMWHISNELRGGCHCKLCEEAFRNWLKERYDNDLDKLNHAWWTAFWSHRYSDWSQIESPSSLGESSLHGLTLDWRRFTTYQMIDFVKDEIAPLKAITPDIPVTTNFMETFSGLDYFKLAEVLDVVSWDNYPSWHNEEGDEEVAMKTGFVHDLNRSLKGGKPFMLMESTPSLVNWHPVNKIKRPGMHLLSSMQAVAHGSDTVQYFQWRKSRGSSEKFHGAVVDHCGHENTRVFRDVAGVGGALKKLDKVVGTAVPAETAIIFDWDNRWAIEDCQALRNKEKDYLPLCQEYYKPLWENGIPTDIIDSEQDFEKYKLIVAPMLYMVKPGVAKRLEDFVSNGGTLVTTYFTGYVNETDLCFLGGFPGPLRKLIGVWAEEMDSLYDTDTNSVIMNPGNDLGIKGEFTLRHYCEVIHAETAEVLAAYKEDYYSGMPAVTVNSFGKGKAYHIAARVDEEFLREFYKAITPKTGITKALDAALPKGVSAQLRTDGVNDFIFIMNFTQQEQIIKVLGQSFKSVLLEGTIENEIKLEPYDIQILEKTR